MDILTALSNLVDYIKKYNDSKYVTYDNIDSTDDYKTPLDYGAGGKGYTDDTNAINQAIEENDVVYIPNGTYNISSPIIISSKGKKIYGNVNTIINAQNCDAITINNPNDLSISNLSIKGDTGTHNGIVINGSGYKCDFTKINISNFGGDAIKTNWFGDGFGVCVIEQCKIVSCGNGIVFLSDALDQRNNITIRNNLFSQITDTAIRFTGVGYIIEGNDIEGCRYGIRVYNFDELPERENVTFAGSHAIRITGNYMEKASKSYISISNNFISGMYAGVRAVTIENNYLFSSASASKEEDYCMVEFVTDTPEQDTVRLSDIHYLSNMAITDNYNSVVTINGSNLLTNDCTFTISTYGTLCRLINMGDAVVVNNNYDPDA